jgi:hypothetical protein
MSESSSIWLLASGAMVLSGFASFVALFWIDAPYGRFAPDKPSCQSFRKRK